ncbi:hypothetical protein D9757_000337 [Collybiopsis confluens]|uniref:Carboxymethylenebutenolidase n=1 Tax=Collybiopsis confluens TaxID=2823264 RepID=A0A8H5MGW1_9AGAR|nr:hypothetical protein D9757_000337 [Collybiopsis confluens]
MAPSSYDPNSAEEQAVSLPSAPLVALSSNAYLQPPLTRRGSGPGMILFLPPVSAYNPNIATTLDPEPIQKWAEEGFAVFGITGDEGWSVEDALTKGIDALLALEELDTKDKFAIYVYDMNVLHHVISYIQNSQDARISCLVAIGIPGMLPSIPTFIYLPPDVSIPQIEHSADYVPGEAALAHSRALVFLRKILGGPIFDLEAIWEEHTYFEFNLRSVAKTMGTMVAEPYVNHVPTMTGGIGRKALTDFYRNHFIFANPADTTMVPVSRTVGSDRIVDEFIFKLTHDKTVDWLLPGVPPGGCSLEIPMVAVVNIRGDRLYHEHIWWDQASALLQAGILPLDRMTQYMSLDGEMGYLEMPIAGNESAQMVLNPSQMKGWSNMMIRRVMQQ